MPATPPEPRVQFRFYAELNDFLSPGSRGRTFTRALEGRNSVKHVVEALGVPHTEIDLILVNGRSVDFGFKPGAGDRVSVYPVFESIDIGALTRVRSAPLRRTCFVLDGHLGKLAPYLRMLGFDTRYRRDCHDAELAAIAASERRILLTMDRGLLKRRMVTHGYCVRETDRRRQVIEVLGRFDLFDSVAPFGRCMRCNARLQAVPKAEIVHRLLPKTRRYYQEFWMCRSCDQIFWQGSHYQHMRGFLREVERERVRRSRASTGPD